MNLEKLCEMQAAGVFKVGKNNTELGTIVIGGMKLTKQQADEFLHQIGWDVYFESPEKIVEKTDSIVKGLCKYIENESVLNTANVCLQNFRKTDSDKFYERINLDGFNFNLTILHGMGGTGGAYALFDANRSKTQPVCSGGSVKSISEYINKVC